MMPMTRETRRIDSGEHSESSDLEQRIKGLFAGYTFEIVWYYSRPLNPECETVEILLTTPSGRKYHSNFTTTKYIDTILRDNQESDPLADGTFFAMPGMVVLKRLTPEHVKRTIDYMIENLEIDEYFEELKNFKE